MRWEQQSNTPRETPPKPGESLDEGALFVNLEIDATEEHALMACLRSVRTYSRNWSQLHWERPPGYFSRLRVTAVLSLSPSTTETIVTELTARIEENLRKHLRPSEILLLQFNWTRSLFDTPTAVKHEPS